MRRIVIGVLTVLFLGCVRMVTVGDLYGLAWLRRQMEEAHEEVALVMSEALYQTATDAIVEAAPDGGQLRIRARDLSVNNTAVAGEAGWETGTGGTVVYGFDLTIVEGEIALGVGNQVMHTGVPVVIDSRLELTEIRTYGEGVFGTVVTADRFECVIETGLNQALAGQGLVPTDVAVRNGVLSVKVEPVTSWSRGHW